MMTPMLSYTGWIAGALIAVVLVTLIGRARSRSLKPFDLGTVSQGWLTDQKGARTDRFT